MKKYSIEIRPIFTQEVDADSWEEAVEKIIGTFEEHPEVYVPDEDEIHNVTPTDNATQLMLDRFKKVIERIEKFWTPNGCVDARGVEFTGGEEIEDEDEEEGTLPKYVYADIHTYDGCDPEKIEKHVEYDVAELLALEKKWAREKK